LATSASSRPAVHLGELVVNFAINELGEIENHKTECDADSGCSPSGLGEGGGRAG
jgi:hypothetical protein